MTQTRRRYAWIVFAVTGGVLAGLSLGLLPHDSGDASVLAFLIKLSGFFFLALGVATFSARTRFTWLFTVLAFLLFAGYLFPRISYFYYGDVDREQAQNFYTHLYWLMYPAVVLSVAGSYRLGGGTSGRCLKIAWSGVLILFSGFLDVMWQLVNPVEIPDRISAAHIVAVVGEPVTFMGAVIFTLAHIPILIILLILPLDRLLDAVLGPDPSVTADP